MHIYKFLESGRDEEAIAFVAHFYGQDPREVEKWNGKDYEKYGKYAMKLWEKMNPQS